MTDHPDAPTPAHAAARAAIDASIGVVSQLRDPAALDRITAAADVLVDTFRGGGRVLSCGNGGSMCDAMHFAEELSGRFRADRPALGAIAISDVGHLTCAANDYGYEQVFARFVEGFARPGDALLAISTSGTSANVRRAAETARARGMHVVALTGRTGSPLGALADVDICTPGPGYADRVQEAHGLVIHILIELVERALHPELYPA